MCAQNLAWRSFHRKERNARWTWTGPLLMDPTTDCVKVQPPIKTRG